MGALRALYPASIHVRDAGLARAEDTAVWNYALEHGLAVVSKDADFHQRSFLSSPAPKVIWIRLGNCTTEAVAELLRQRRSEIAAFLSDADAMFLALG